MHPGPLRTSLRGFLVGALVLILVVGLGVGFLALTPVGHELVRERLVGILQGAIPNGTLRVGRLTGNLLDGLVAHDVVVTDTAGAPFLAAERLEADYSLLTLLRRKLVFDDVVLVNPVVVLDRGPRDEDWNFERIFEDEDDGPDAPDTTLSWGDWVELREVRLVSGRVVVRRPWEPDDELAGAARDSAIRAALGGDPDGLGAVERVPGGFQEVLRFADIDARLPYVRLQHPWLPGAIAVADLSMVGLPIPPPALVVRDFEGMLHFTGDSLWWETAVARLPASRVAGSGLYSFETGDFLLRLRGPDVAFRDFQWVLPQLPTEGGGRLTLELALRDEAPDVFDIDDAVLTSGDAFVAGDLGFAIGEDSLRFFDTELRARQVDVRLLERLLDVEVPVRGEVGGTLALAGPTEALRVRTDLRFTPPGGVPSALVARGLVGFLDDAVRADELYLESERFDLALLEPFAPDLPLEGVVSGAVTVEGRTGARLAGRGRLRYAVDGRVSELAGRAEVGLAGERPVVDVDVRATPLELATLDRLLPADLGLRGAVRGPVRLRGTLDRFDVLADLEVVGGGALAVRGEVGLRGERPRYDLVADARSLNLSQLLAAAPETDLTGRIRAAGAGFDPATLDANIQATLAGLSLRGVAIDTLRVDVAAANGLARVDTLLAEGPGLRFVAEGTFGLRPGRTGTLTYALDVDSLDALAPVLPGDTGVVRPRPGALRRAVAQAREDSATLAQATEVERAMAGLPAPALQVDTPQVVRRDSLAGQLAARGRVTGRLGAFDVFGAAAGEDLVVQGNRVDGLRAEYAVTGVGTPATRVALAANLDSVQAAGFALDSAFVRLAYENGAGTARVLVDQSEGVRYAAAADFRLDPEENEVRITEAELQFAEDRWVATGPGVIRWGPRGIAVESLELVSGEDGRIYVDGLLPTEGRANLAVDISQLDLANVAALLQTDLDLGGELSLEGRLTGTGEDLDFRGAVGLLGGRYQGTDLPELHGRLAYGGERLALDIVASREGERTLATVEGSIPFRLGLGGGTPGLGRGPIRLDVVADSLQLAQVPDFTEAISGLRGIAAGRVAVRGTVDEPRIVGGLVVDQGALTLAPIGVELNDVTAILRMRGDTIVVDSLVGYAGGPVSVEGFVALEEGLRDPFFALRLQARNAVVLDDERGHIEASAQLALVGPIDRALLRGDVIIEEGVYYLPETGDSDVISATDPDLYNVVDTALVTNREILPSPNPFLENLTVDLDLVVTRDTWVRSQDANVEVYGEADVTIPRGGTGIQIDGVINAERGEYTFLGKRFEITRGVVQFTGAADLNPILQITGEYRVAQTLGNAVTIRILIGGTLESPRLVLESDALPPIPQSDLISYLAFGSPTSSLFGVDSPIGGSSAPGDFVNVTAALAAKQLAGLALGALLNQFEGEATRALGVDVFNITPANIPSQLSFRNFGLFVERTEIEAGRYINPRTFVAIQLQPSRETFTGQTLPGLVFDHRMGNMLEIRASLEPRFLLRPPSLGADIPYLPKTALGVFLIKEWRY